MSKLSEILKELRKARGLSQSQLAQETNLSVHSINSYESGRREPNSKAMAALESFFHVTGEYLRGETDTIESTYQWENTEIIEAVRESFGSLIDKLLSLFQDASELEQKMLFDMLVELCHVAGIKNGDESFRSASFLLLQENFVHTTRFIDICRHLTVSAELEASRIEKLRTDCIENFSRALSEFQASIYKDTPLDK